MSTMSTDQGASKRGGGGGGGGGGDGGSGSCCPLLVVKVKGDSMDYVTSGLGGLAVVDPLEARIADLEKAKGQSLRFLFSFHFIDNFQSDSQA